MSRLAVVGGGIAGLAAAWEASRAGASVVVLEAGNRLGGKLSTVPFAGARFEPAPDAFLARRPEAVQLCRELGIEDELVEPSASAAWIWSRGALRRLPAGLVLGVPTDPGALRASGIVSPWAALRAAVEPWLPGRPLAGDDAVGRVIGRRFGREVADRLVDSLVGGINAGDTAELSIDVAAPQLAAAARRHRSLTRALRDAPAPPAQPGRAPVFLAPEAGMGRLADALVAALTDAGVELRVRSAVDRLEPRAGGGYRLLGADVGGDGGGVGIDVDAVVLAAPTFVSGPLVAPHAPAAAAALAAVHHAAVSVVALAYPAGEVPVRDGTGYLVPRRERLLMTACTWLTSKWGHLRPVVDGRPQAVLKVSAGRHGDLRHLALDDDELVARIRDDLATTMGLRAAPTEVAVHRWPRAFPQYRPGHLERMAAAAADLARDLPGVALAGAAVAGVGVPACIGSGRAAATAALAAGTPQRS